ncbi:c-type cytochrome [Telluribacter humicola]|uniref:c-type cytochrome n=1 Tax=Telluribacter humicola TaxID=1720261 RepID=UPI001A95952E|nr:c-type cytochrome [Telluribacter humicola]
MAQEDSFKKTIRSLQQALLTLAGLVSTAVVIVIWGAGLQLGWFSHFTQKTNMNTEITGRRTPLAADSLWRPPAQSLMNTAQEADLIKYGQDLIVNTAKYLGPKGNVVYSSNGMNCQNCHLEAGGKPWGNNYGAVASTFPKYRERSGTVENTSKRVNDCFERSLNGKALDTNSREIKAIVAYLHFVGRDVPKGKTPRGTGIWHVPYMDRAADPEKGKLVYQQKCAYCHGSDGQGVGKAGGTGYVYPPLWGKNSYNKGAGLYRISRLAGYIKTSMPLGASWDKPQLSDEESWDIAAYINSRPRPAKDLSRDWPSIAGKPIDHPFGPYTDPFSEKQHKFGPFKPIKQWQDQHTLARKK